MAERNPAQVIENGRKRLVETFVVRADDARLNAEAAEGLEALVPEVPDLADNASDEQKAEHDELVRQHNIAISAKNRSVKRARKNMENASENEEMLQIYAQAKGLDYEPLVPADETA